MTTLTDTVTAIDAIESALRTLDAKANAKNAHLLQTRRTSDGGWIAHVEDFDQRLVQSRSGHTLYATGRTLAEAIAVLGAFCDRVEV